MNTVDFKIDKMLLSDSIFTSPNKSLSFYPPKYWFRVTDNNSEIWKRISSQLGNNLLAIYKIDSPDCVLIVSDFSNNSSLFNEVIIKDPNAYFNKDSIWNAVQSSNFEHNSHSIFQIVLQNSELVIFKLFIYSNLEIFELDYFIPRKEIQNLIQFVESSIGSIN